jgi:methionyl-tRNA formyltransferase
VEEEQGRGVGLLRIVFWGTPIFALPSLRALGEEGHDVVGVVTQPDRPAGRGRRLRPSPVKEVAIEEELPVLTPRQPWGEDFVGEFAALDPELSVVVAYGHILKPEILELPPLGSINVHASLLPELRGAAPVSWAIIRGYARSGVTIMRMVEAMDAGPVLFQIPEDIDDTETATELGTRLSELGAEALIEALALMEGGVLEEVEQDHSLATFAPKLSREKARIDWDIPAGQVADHIRGLDGVPGAWTLLGEEPVKLFQPRPEPDLSHSAGPGTILRGDPHSGLVVAAGAGAVAIGEVQPPGRRRMTAEDWLRGHPLPAGLRFE